MFRTAFAAGPRPAAIDLPPTLQPMAISHAAPRTDKRLALLGAAAIYGCIPLALMSIDRFMPELPHVPVPATERPPIVFELRPEGGPAPIPAALAGPVHVAAGPHDATLIPAPRTLDDQASEATPDNLNIRPQTPIQGGGGSNATPGTSNPGPIGPAGSGPFGMQGAVADFTATGLQVLKQVEPLYPPVARAARIQGSVVLRMVVDERGLPMKADVIEGPALLRAEALRAAQQWEFVPARVGSQPVMATFLLTLKFRLI